MNLTTNHLLGGGRVETHVDDMIGGVALEIEMGADAVDFGKKIHPHPTLGQSIYMAADLALGSILQHGFVGMIWTTYRSLAICWHFRLLLNK